MNVYLRTEDDIELVGHTSLEDGQADKHIVDVAIPSSGAALRLVYELGTVPCLTPELRLGTERAVVLALGQTPDFLPGWERVED